MQIEAMRLNAHFANVRRLANGPPGVDRLTRSIGALRSDPVAFCAPAT